MKLADDKLLVFAHMMKTAGTSLSRELIAHFGARMHIVPGGLKMADDSYGRKDLEADIARFNDKLQLITGHPMRPYIDFGALSNRMKWFAFFREPQKRYVSHFLHDLKWTDNFSYRRYERMKDKSIKEWEKIENYRNYQTRFIAGEENVEKAIDMLENRFCWVGITEEYQKSIQSLNVYFDLNTLNSESRPSNASSVDEETRRSVHEYYSDFIAENNENDIQLYKYVKEKMWPRYRALTAHSEAMQAGKGARRIRRSVNTILFHISRQAKGNKTKFNFKNLGRFYNRWYR